MTQTGRLYLVDTSALVRAELPQVRYTIQALITDRVAASCAFVDLAAGYSGRTVADLTTIEARRRERYTTLALTEESAVRAREVQLALAAAGVHRNVGILDLLTAALAEHHGAVLLHYAAAFEAIGAITGQPHLWVAPRGSLEPVPEIPAEIPTAVLPPPPAAPPERPARVTIDEFLAAKRARDGVEGPAPWEAFVRPEPVADYAEDTPDR